MFTNADITLYSKSYDSNLGQDVYKRTVIKNVFLDEMLGSNKSKSDRVAVDKALLILPLGALQGYLTAKKYKGATNTFTVKIGDIVVKGVSSYEIINKASELYNDYDVFTVTSVDDKRFGSKGVQHLELGLS